MKEKKCKGTGNAIGYGCGKLQINRKFGLGLGCKCYQTWLYSTEKGKEYLSKITLKVSKPRLEFEKAEKEQKENNRLKYLLVNVRTICHNFVKKRDYKKPCISCGISFSDNFQAGHFYKAELYSNLKFDENNIHGQCQKCNLFKEGNESGYRAGLIQRYGIEFVNSLDEKAKHYKQNTFKWDIEELENIREYYKEKLKNIN